MTEATKTTDTFAMFKARCARAGIKLARHSSEAGLAWYTASKWGHMKTFTALADVEKWLKHIAGPKA